MKIIVVEDEPKSREGILNILARDTEYEVAAVCGNGKEGLEAVKEHRPDLVISDIKMPVMGGLEMLEGILKEGIEVQAVLLTGYSEFEYARRALKLQVVEYVLKPLEVEGFLEVLRKVEGNIEKGVCGAASLDLFYRYRRGETADRADLKGDLAGRRQDTDHPLLYLSLQSGQ